MASRFLSNALLAGVVTAALPAAAQYRQGTPPVLTPAPSQDAATAAREEASFRAAYAKAGSPRIAVFWNRQLTDSLSTHYDQVQQAALQTSSARVTQASPAAVVSAQQSTAVATVREGERALPDAGAQRSLLSEGSEWPIASAFNTRLQHAGVRLIDRTMAMRVQAAGESVESRRDVQAMEIKSLQGKSELLAEVLQTADARAAFGVIFRVEIKDVKTGELLASVVSEGKPASRGPGRFVAGRSGFEREKPAEPTLTDIGEVVANATLQALAARWR